ncbi:MAG: hypothetical protein ACK4MX_10460 [Thermaurantiacus sp.]
MFLKDPDARLDYEVDWSAVCGPDRDIVQSEWTVTPPREAGVTIVDESLEDCVARVWVQGGQDGDVVALVNRAMFSDGAIDERSVAIRVGER